MQLKHYCRDPVEVPNASQAPHRLVLHSVAGMQARGLPYEHVYDELTGLENLVIPAEAALTMSEVLRDAGFKEMPGPGKATDFYDRWEHNIDKKIDKQELPKDFKEQKGLDGYFKDGEGD